MFKSMLYLPCSPDYPPQDEFPSGPMPMIAGRQGVDQGIKAARGAHCEFRRCAIRAALANVAS
jgi:hypothetical protein